MNKLGNLQPYRGQEVRIVCAGQDSFYRFYMVGVLGESDLSGEVQSDP